MNSRDQEQDIETRPETARAPEAERSPGAARVPSARHGDDGEPDASQAGTVAECVARLVAQAPPLTARQRETLTLLLRRTHHHDQHRSPEALAWRG
jgi:hypothetical protein